MSTCLAIPASTLLLASATGGGTTVARILGQESEPAPIYATPLAPDFKPPVEIPASALDKANGARKFSLSSVLLASYQSAVDAAPAGCHLSVPLLAAIGQVESGSLVDRSIDERHRVTQPVLGPVLDGNGFAAVPDTDNGTMDGNKKWDRAMGPMQFIPSTWRTFGVDADGDGVKDPQDVDDAAAATAAYLCDGGRDLGTEAGEREAVLSYNNSQAYYFLVLRWKEAFEHASSLVVVPPDTTSAAVSVAASAMLAPEGAPASPGPSVAPAPRPTAAPIVKAGKSSGHSGPAGSPGGSSSPGSSGGGTSTHGGPTPSPSGSATGSPTGSPSGSPTGGTTAPGAPSTGGPTTPAGQTPGGPTTSPKPSTSPSTEPDDREPDAPGCPVDGSVDGATDGATDSATDGVTDGATDGATDAATGSGEQTQPTDDSSTSADSDQSADDSGALEDAGDGTGANDGSGCSESPADSAPVK